MGNPFLNSLVVTPFFLKEGAGWIKKGANAPPFERKRVRAKSSKPKCIYQVSFGIGMVNTGKIPTDTNTKNTESVSNSGFLIRGQRGGDIDPPPSKNSGFEEKSCGRY